jgi:hypothetical protein
LLQSKKAYRSKAQINRVMLGARLGGAEKRASSIAPSPIGCAIQGRSQQFKAAVQVQTGGDGGYLVLPEPKKPCSVWLATAWQCVSLPM